MILIYTKIIIFRSTFKQLKFRIMTRTIQRDNGKLLAYDEWHLLIVQSKRNSKNEVHKRISMVYIYSNTTVMWLGLGGPL